MDVCDNSFILVTRRSAYSLIFPYLIKPITYHVCPNDCVLFRGECVDLIQCPECGANRYKRGKLPAKTFRYMPLGPRLERMYATKNIAQIMQTHTSSHGIMFNVHDSPSWSKAYSLEGVFHGDSRGVSLALCTDGVNPFSHQRVTYSMWPIMLTNLNLPRNVRSKFSNILLVGIIPGNGTKEPRRLSPYLEVVVDELLALTDFRIYDAYSGALFKLKVELLMYTLDYPGINKVFSCSGAGAYSECVWCEIKGKPCVLMSTVNAKQYLATLVLYTCRLLLQRPSKNGVLTEQTIPP